MVSLWADHGYGLSEIALMFGLSRQRVDQITHMRATECGERGTRWRRWNDAANRFVPVDGTPTQNRRAERAMRNRARREARDAEIIRRAEVGETGTHIAAAMGLRPTAVSKVMVAHGLRRAPGRKHLDRAALLRLWESCATCREIAIHFGISDTAIEWHLRASGAQRRRAIGGGAWRWAA